MTNEWSGGPDRRKGPSIDARSLKDLGWISDSLEQINQRIDLVVKQCEKQNERLLDIEKVLAGTIDRAGLGETVRGQARMVLLLKRIAFGAIAMLVGSLILQVVPNLHLAK